ncbi:uracil-DNA glycosylase [Corallincola holothuriorum]|uniref:Uracil-DNA glycosylase n=1 Tax=Corallincola holothuriorum TaxID=2282215 RepID=A0A368NMK1_9GAMM|nr:uracil-DNA glycosylase [Corallincola holothuriorum]RCU51812.1 uracil-DNA glycosylase [Corallincola holothuriorum]
MGFASWQELIEQEKQQAYFQQTLQAVEHARRSGVTVYPPHEQVFEAFQATGLEQLKVVILGQDPYHGPAQAHGLCFSVQHGVTPPPSLKNIYKELANDVSGFQIPTHGNLRPWAEQGVLLLNTVLTVEAGKAHSHAKFGWETFTDAVIAKINQHQQDIVFMLWGAHAQKKGRMIDRQRHTVLEAPHPSPLSAHRGFFGCGHFSQANDRLVALGKNPIQWQV